MAELYALQCVEAQRVDANYAVRAIVSASIRHRLFAPHILTVVLSVLYIRRRSDLNKFA